MNSFSSSHTYKHTGLVAVYAPYVLAKKQMGNLLKKKLSYTDHFGAHVHKFPLPNVQWLNLTFQHKKNFRKISLEQRKIESCASVPCHIHELADFLDFVVFLFTFWNIRNSMLYDCRFLFRLC